MVRSLQQSQYACADRLADGTIIRLRPIRPEDETLLEEFAAHMSPEDMRLRFFAAMRGLSRELAARLSHIDHDSEAALLAFAEDTSELLGVARFSADAGNHTAEFANRCAQRLETAWARSPAHDPADRAGAAARHR
jgi:hypothetical protein